jgi:hypothetical protein
MTLTERLILPAGYVEQRENERLREQQDADAAWEKREREWKEREAAAKADEKLAVEQAKREAREKMLASPTPPEFPIAKNSGCPIPNWAEVNRQHEQDLADWENAKRSTPEGQAILAKIEEERRITREKAAAETSARAERQRLAREQNERTGAAEAERQKVLQADRERAEKETARQNLLDRANAAGLLGKTYAELQASSGALSWLAESIFVAGQPAVIAGPPKTLKTGVMIDLAVSLAAGKPFLGRYATPAGGTPVLVFSGESGDATIRDTIKRVADARGVDPAGLPLHVATTLPRLNTPENRQLLRQSIEANGTKVVAFDPLYLLAMSASDKPVNSADVFAMGRVFQQIAETCLNAGATPVLVHHSVKGLWVGKAMELNDLAAAGISEFARQWLLINVRRRYTGDGNHRLIVAAGGSAGHSSTFALDVSEGIQAADFTGRHWTVSVDADLEAVKERDRADRNAKRQAQADGAAPGPMRKIVQAVDALRLGEPVSLRAIRTAAHVNDTAAKAGVAKLIEAGRLVRDGTKYVRQS